jgi:lysophospholipase L1-like esterase
MRPTCRMKFPSSVLLLLVLSVALTAAENPITYLALGDSVSFGMNDALVPPYTNMPVTPSEFVGYPETVAALRPPFSISSLANAACPGETSGSFLNTAWPDNGCNSQHVVYPPPGSTLPPIYLPPFKPAVGLHVSYAESQMAYALSQLGRGNHVNLVTLMIGANDVLLVLPELETCAPQPTCAQTVLGGVLEAYGNNLAQILGGIRAVYSGTLVLVTYYAPSPALNSIALALNSTMTTVAANFPRITIADGYKTFQLASTPFGGDPCAAGLLIKLPPNPYNSSACDIHPSPIGRDLLAATVDFALLPKL